MLICRNAEGYMVRESLATPVLSDDITAQMWLTFWNGILLFIWKYNRPQSTCKYSETHEMLG